MDLIWKDDKGRRYVVVIGAVESDGFHADTWTFDPGHDWAILVVRSLGERPTQYEMHVHAARDSVQLYGIAPAERQTGIVGPKRWEGENDRSG